MIRLGYVTALLLSSSPVIAASGFRNGGDAVLCFDSALVAKEVRERLFLNKRNPRGKVDPLGPNALESLSSAALLDLYLLERMGLETTKSLVSLPENISYLQFAHDRFQKLIDKAPLAFANRLEQLRFILPTDEWIGLESGVAELSDFDVDYYLPENCLMMQMAVQNSLKVFFERRIFNRLPELHKAAFVTHEWLSSLSRNKKQHPTPLDIHALNGLLYLEDFQDMDKAHIHRFLEARGFFKTR